MLVFFINNIKRLVFVRRNVSSARWELFSSCVIYMKLVAHPQTLGFAILSGHVRFAVDTVAP
jgi:hypothetical protein